LARVRIRVEPGSAYKPWARYLDWLLRLAAC